MRNRIIQVRHYSRKMMIMMLTGAICFSSCFCETAFAKTSKVTMSLTLAKSRNRKYL